MIVRIILLVLAALLVLRLLGRFLLGLFVGLSEPPRESARGRGRGSERAKVAGALVQDPVCGTYIPRDTAIAVSAGAGTRFYCSEACRDKDRFTAQAVKGRAAHG
jgi:YHS domain-containing protein